MCQFLLVSKTILSALLAVFTYLPNSLFSKANIFLTSNLKDWLELIKIPSMCQESSFLGYFIWVRYLENRSTIVESIVMCLDPNEKLSLDLLDYVDECQTTVDFLHPNSMIMN